MKPNIKVLGSGCTKCKVTYQNVLEALKQLHVEADVEKIEDMDGLIRYQVLSTPVLMINGVAKVKGRVADIHEIKTFLI